MDRRDFLWAMGAGALSAAASGVSAPAGEQIPQGPGRRPNFVFFLIDDMGWADVGCNGSRFHETPNIDRLAAEGMRFTDGYAACPVCSPTRASIMCGKYPARIHLTNFIYGRKMGKLLPPTYEAQMRLEEVTIAEALKEAGYTTCFVGKWHLGDKGYFPEDQGFDVNIGGCRSGMPRSFFWPKWRGNPPIEGRDGEYLTDRLTDEALKFLDGVGGRPFLLYLSHYAVHIPIEAKEALIEKYRTKAEELGLADITPRFLPEGDNQARQVQDHAAYAAMVESVDQSVGRVLDKLREMDAADNTVVFFMSDNGGLSTAEGSPTSNRPLRAGKGWLYEGGIREPWLVKWPGVTKPGSTCNEPVTSTDFYPTILEMAALPARPEQHTDGVSIVPLLRGERHLNRQAIYWHYPHYSNQGGGPGGAVRLGDFKLIKWYEDSRVELYNLRKDIGEQNDLAARDPRRARNMERMLDEWLTDVDAQMPAPNPDYRPAPQSH